MTRKCAPVRKWGTDHKGFLAISCCTAVSKKFLHNFYFWSKHHARPVRCGGELPRIYHRDHRDHGETFGLNQEEDFLATDFTV